jgi:hypothetical protein
MGVSALKKLGMFPFGDSRPQQAPVPQPPDLTSIETSPLLMKLAPETILGIFEFLQPQYALAFSLSCRYVYFLLGKISISQDDSYEFFALLERQLPNHILCYYCRSLHPLRRTRMFTIPLTRYYGFIARGYHRYLECFKSYVASRKEYADIHDKFTYPVFHHAMTQYRNGNPYPRLLSILCESRSDMTEHYSAEPRIVNGSLFLRHQQRFLALPSQPFPDDPNFHTCPHITVATDTVTEIYWEHQIRSRIFVPTETRELSRYINPQDPKYWGELIHCQYCLSEFRIDVKYEAGIMWLVFTGWRNLGQGKSPLDYKLRTQIDWDTSKWHSVAFIPGALCAAFEGEDASKFDPFVANITTEK